MADSDGCTGTYSDLWSLPAGTQPVAGTNAVAVTFSGLLGSDPSRANLEFRSVAVSAWNVSQTTTFSSTASNSGSGTSATVTPPASYGNELVIDSACTGTNVDSTPQTSLWTLNPSQSSCGSSGLATAAGGTTSLSWTVDNDIWAIIAASFNPWCDVGSLPIEHGLIRSAIGRNAHDKVGVHRMTGDIEYPVSSYRAHQAPG